MMKMRFSQVKVCVLAASLATFAAQAAAQQPAPAPAPTAPPAPNAPAAQATPGQAPAVEPYVVGEATRDLTLEQAIEIALENNLDLKVARLNPQIQDYSLQAARASFRPTLTGTFNQNHGSQISTN